MNKGIRGLQCRSSWVTLAVAEWERSLQFYRHLLGEEPRSHIPNTYAEFQFPGLRLGLYQPRLTEPSFSLFPSLSLCLEVEDLEGAIAHLSQIGYPPPGEVISASHGREIYAYDPDGNRLILYQPQR
ncbi:MAG: VOC family protein [Leptolyngbyaceae cyanobacterium CSU_1_3]|nr:VOC family protein [Leptolyngbyaceae cyanobacterium CSU_1_3]